VETLRLAEGLWRWTAAPGAWSVYYEAPDAVVLFDPLVPDGEEEKLLAHLDRDVERLGLPVSILLTALRHERSGAFLRERYGGNDRVPASVEAYPLDGDRTAYLVRPQRALVVPTLDLLPAAIGELPVELVLVSSPAPAQALADRGSSGR
jgi:hypothetical protein